MNRERYRRLSEGSYTLEATVTVSLSLIVVFAFLFFALFLREQCIFRELIAMKMTRFAKKTAEPVTGEGRMDLERFGTWPLLYLFPDVDPEESMDLSQEIISGTGARFRFLQIAPMNVFLEGRTLSVTYRNGYKRGVPYVFKSLFRFRAEELSYQTELAMEPEEFVRLCRGIIRRD